MSETANAASVDNKPASPAKVLGYFGFFLYGVGALILCAMIFMSIGEIRLAIAGSDGRATIIDSRTHTYSVVHSYGTTVRRETRTDFYLTYKFIIGGQPYQRERAVSKKLYKSVGRGQEISVRYLTNDPSFSTIDRERDAWNVIISGLLAVLFIGAGFFFHKISKRLLPVKKE